ncbi:MAG: HAMP domain-containing protein [Ktedonobacteraceae bacterium]|nr:HAMP domain-containing protein [Ktedonobacteraceae bacterium]
MIERLKALRRREAGRATRRTRRAKYSGLQAQMRALYIKITLGVIALLLCLYAAFLVGQLRYTLSLTPPTSGGHLSALQDYPVEAGLVMLMVTLIIAPLVGGFFGTLATRDLLRRVHDLIRATKQVTEGDYMQRVSVTASDEIGQLEQQFNGMAEQLAESTTRQRELAGQKARLAERTRISRELHDAISQDLFSLSTITAGLQAALPTDSPLQSQATTLEQTARNMRREMRALLLELRPTRLEQLGLTESLQEMAAAYRTRLGIEVTTSIEPVSLPPEREEMLLRIAQESVSNAVRHGGARVITLVLKPATGKVELSITDDGSGFDLERSQESHGLGLRLMQERVQEAGGTLYLHTAPGEGTRISVQLWPEETHDSYTDRR